MLFPEASGAGRKPGHRAIYRVDGNNSIIFRADNPSAPGLQLLLFSAYENPFLRCEGRRLFIKPPENFKAKFSGGLAVVDMDVGQTSKILADCREGFWQG